MTVRYLSAGLALMGAGAILVSAGPALAQAAPAGDAEAGADLYSTECRGCHSVSIAPTHRGLINRPAASVAAFTGYSDALKAKGAAGLVWTETNISTFITGPQNLVPGTLMTKIIADPQQRADIIAYIATLPPPRQQ
ncbi:MAG TPA: c-type cytochrome [Hyphomonadaceae bacterium]|nr:c-type cytochrome [Hyphomonadaceae bacterium]